MRPVTAGDICERFGWNRSTLKYHRQRGFPEPRWHVGGKRASACWRLADVVAWDRGRKNPRTNYPAALALLDQLGTLRGAAKLANVSERTFTRFLAESGERDRHAGALYVLRTAVSHAEATDQPEAAELLRKATRALENLR